MAAILQFRQGSKSSFISSGPYISEPFFDTDTNIIHIGVSGSSSITLVKLDEINSGSLSLSGDLTASNIAADSFISNDGGNVISGSEQITNLGFISSSDSTTSLNTFTSSIQTEVDGLSAATSSYLTSSGSVDFPDITSVPSGLVSGSTQIDTGSIHFQEGVELYSINGINPASGIQGSANSLGVKIRGLSADGLSFDGPGNLIIDTGSDYFVSGAQDASLASLPEGTVSSSQQVIDFLPSGTLSGSSQVSAFNTFLEINGDSVVSGSTQTLNHLESETLVGINITNPTSYGADGELQINGTTTGYSGILQLLSGSTSTYVNYVTEADKMVNFQAEAGYGLQLTPDSTSSKSWVIDTDGDLVGQGTNDVYAEYVYADISNTTITTSSVDSRELLFKDTNNYFGGSSVYTISETATIAINDSTPSTGGVNGELIINSTTSGFSGLLTQDIAETTIYQQYGTSADSLVNFMASSGYGLYLSVDGDTKSWTIDTDGDLVGSGSQNIYTNHVIASGTVSGSNIHSEGTVTAEGDIVAYVSSDERLKDKIQSISTPLEKINSIGGYSFVWNTQKQDIYKGKDYGVIAQEIEKILPELVDNRKDGYKAVKYDRLVSLLIEGIKELSSEVKELKEKINKE